MEKQTIQAKGSNIIVKDYIYKGNYIFGTFYQIKDGVDTFILDDGDIYSLKDLEEEGYVYIRLHSRDIIDKFKDKFKEVSLLSSHD